MKQLILFITLVLLLIGCGKADEEKKSADNAVEVAEIKKPAGPVYNLSYKFKVGDKFSYKLYTNSENSEEIIADTTLKNEIKQNATYRFDIKVKGIDDYNIADLEVTINSILAETNLNGQQVNYDSKFIYSSREKVQFVDYESVKKVPFRISVNKLGQVIKVDKIDRIMKNILNIQNVPDTLSAATKEKMKFNIANGTLMPLTQQLFKVLPENEIGIDSVWQMKYTTPLAVFNLENTAVFRVTNFNYDKDTTIEMSSDILTSISGNNVVTENGMQYKFSNPDLNSQGSIKFNYSKGLVEESVSNTKLIMSMTVEGFDSNNQKIRSIKNDISNNTNTVELL